MADVTRRIGLSLGADICWPICYEELIRRLDLAIPWDGDTVRFEVERVTIEPFEVAPRRRYDVVVDRLTHWFHTSREWIKKSVIMDGLYVFNNPWSVQANEKHTTYCAMMALGMPIPDTWMVPPKSYEPTPDLKPTLSRYAKLFDVKRIGERIGWPMFMKPYDGGGWRGVSKVDIRHRSSSAPRSLRSRRSPHTIRFLAPIERPNRWTLSLWTTHCRSPSRAFPRDSPPTGRHWPSTNWRRSIAHSKRPSIAQSHLSGAISRASRCRC